MAEQNLDQGSIIFLGGDTLSKLSGRLWATKGCRIKGLSRRDNHLRLEFLEFEGSE